MSKLTGGSSAYYELPKDVAELQDIIEWRNMNFAIGNIFKAAYRLGEKPNTSTLYDLDKIIWFAEREKRRVQSLQSPITTDAHIPSTAPEGWGGNAPVYNVGEDEAEC